MKRQNHTNKKLSLNKLTVTKLDISEKKYIRGAGNNSHFPRADNQTRKTDGSRTSIMTSSIECLLTTN